MKKSDINLSELDHTEKVEGAAPVEGLKPTDGVVQESMVDVLYMLSPEGKRLIRIKVWSKNKPGLFSFSDIYCDGLSRAVMATKCERIGASLAERQITLYMDAHDPSLCARMAKKHYLELCDHLQAQIRGGQR